MQYLLKMIVEWLLSWLATSMRSPHGGLSGWTAKLMMKMGNPPATTEAICRLELKATDDVFVELGAGNGAGLLALEGLGSAQRPKRIVCVEISQDYRDELESLKQSDQISFGDAVEIYPNDCKDMSSFLKDDSVEKMFGMNVVYFLHPLEEYLVEIHRVLKKGGVISFGCKFAMVPKSGDVFINTDEKEIVAKMEQAGFIDVKSTFVDLGEPAKSFTEIIGRKG